MHVFAGGGVGQRDQDALLQAAQQSLARVGRKMYPSTWKLCVEGSALAAQGSARHLRAGLASTTSPRTLHSLFVEQARMLC